MQPDGKILVAGLTGFGNGDFDVARYNSNGSLDSTFGSDGKVTTDFGGGWDGCYSLALLSDGKILVAGLSGDDFALARYNGDGSLDTTFHTCNTRHGAPTYIEHGSAVVLDNIGQIFDAELAASNNYAGASLRLARHDGTNANDLFSGAGIVAAVASGVVTIDDTDIGIYTWTAGTLTLSFNNNATKALVNHAMQSLAYEYASDAPPSSVQIDWTFNDGDSRGALSTIGSTLFAIDKLPTFTDFTYPVATTAEDHAVKISFSDLLAHSNATDVDGTVESFTVKGVISGILTIGNDEASAINNTIDATHDAWWTPESNTNGTLDTFVVVAHDNDGGESISAMPVTVTVSAENDAPTFINSNGKVTNDFGSSDYGNSVTVQADGKILLAGSSDGDFAAVRYKSDGSLDTTFGSDGIVTTDFGGSDYCSSITVQPDGKILLAGLGNGKFALARYNSGGSLDTSFDYDGKLATDLGRWNGGYSVALQSDGKILVAGSNDGDFAVARYNSDGSLDTSFDYDGIVTTDLGRWFGGCSVTVQADGKILVTGASGLDFAVARYNYDGSLDTSFDYDGKVTAGFGGMWNYGNSVALQPDGKILFAVGGGWVSSGGHSGSTFALARYNYDGSPDTSFDYDGKLATYFGNGVTVQPDGKILVEGYSVTVQSDGKILVADTSAQVINSDFPIARYNNDGSLDTSFNYDGKLASDFGNSITVQPDGKILVAGTSAQGINSNFAVARYNSDGSLDTTFNAFNTLNGTPTYLKNGHAVVLDSDVQIFDAELATSNNYAGASLMLARHGGANADDLFSGAGIVAAAASGTVTIDSTNIATCTWSAGTLALVFNNNATQALVNHAMQSLVYENASDAPPSSVQIDWTFNDGDSSGALSTIGSTLMTIVTDPVATTAEDQAVNISFSDLFAYRNGSEVDGAVESFTVKTINSGALTIGRDASTATAWDAATNHTIDATHDAWWRPNQSANGMLDAFTVVAHHNDGEESITTTPAIVNVASVNDAPTFIPCNGKVTTDFGSNDDGNSVAVQADSKILFAGSSGDDFALARYNSDGSIDTSFSSDGKLVTDFAGSDDHGSSVTVQLDGKILVAGSSDGDFALARYNSDGLLDTSFSYDGRDTTNFGGSDDSCNNVTMQADGKILVTGSSGGDFAVARYNSDGSLDTTFNGFNTLNGAPTYIKHGNAVVLDNDVQIFDAELAASNNYAGASLTLARHGGASADDRFSGPGIVAAASGTGGIVTVDGTDIGTYILAAGTLTLVFDNNATQALVNHAMQSLFYENASDAPPSSVQIDWTFNDGDSSGALSTTGNTMVLITNGQAGIAQDGYLAHTLVWVDSNNNGARDWADTNSNGLWDSGEGEAWTQTDSTGQFSSLPDNGTLRIAANPAGGSTDISTGLPFTGTFSAPSGSTVINPLTTLLVAAGGDATIVNKALGLDIALNLATYDPLAALSASGASSGDQAQALAIQCKAIQIANIMDIAISAAHGAGATNANMSDMTTRIGASLLSDAGTGAVNLDNSAVIANAITSAAQTVVGDTTALNAQKTAIADATALINSKIGAASSGSDLPGSITSMVAAQIVAQETLASQASQAIQNNSSASLTLNNENIDSAISAATSQVGVIHPPTITNFSPLDGATVPVDSDLHFTFTDAIQRGIGLIEIHRDSATGPIVESYDPLHNGNLSLSGNVLTVNPTNNLDHNSHYYVTFAQSSIDNLFGDHFIGSVDYDLFTVADPCAESDGNGDSTQEVLLGIGGLALLAWVLL